MDWKAGHQQNFVFLFYVYFNHLYWSAVVLVQLCDPMDCSTPGFPAHHQLQELAQIHGHQAADSFYCTENESAIHIIYLLPFGLPSHLGHHRALSRALCVIQSVFISYLFYT